MSNTTTLPRNSKTDNPALGAAIESHEHAHSYDGLSLSARQVLFPMGREKGGWPDAAKNPKAKIDRTSIQAYRDTVSLPLAAGKQGRVAATIVEDRGIESSKVFRLAG